MRGRAPWALAVALVLLAAPASGQALRVVAFGDSVTEAIPFDLASPSCQASNPDTCGYTGRLASSRYYDCRPSSCTFANRGRSGEKTAQALSRIDPVLRERDWDLLILMEGTNDLASVSPQTTLFNLALMADKAEARGVGVAPASIIWYNPSVPRSQTPGLNAAAGNLRALIRSRAASERQCFVDAYNQLCPAGASQAGCFAKNYWVPPAGGVDFVGHPNPRGYDVLAREFYRVLGAAGAPGAVEIVEPTDEVCGDQAALAWDRETVAGTGCGNWFRVQIDGPRGTPLDRWFSEGDVCDRSGCQTVAPVSLKEGSHSIRIQTRNTAGYGPWSAERAFTVVPRAPAKIRVLRAPQGRFYEQGGVAAEFRWQPEGPADSYRLEVKSGSKTVLDETLDEGLECSRSECAFTLADSLGAGRYTWRVLAQNICGGTWSEAALFEIFDSPPARAPEAVGPTQRIFDRTPLLRWKTVAGADAYDVEDPSGNTIRLPAAGACRGDTCRFPAAALAPGVHSWRVRAANPLGDGAWSPALSFEVADCDCFEGFAAGGASFLLAVPDPWNGDLVIWSHPSNAFRVLEIEEFGPLAQRQFDAGYALATTSYSVSGWPLFRSQRDLERVFTVFSARYGRPRNVFLAGKSVGALVTAAALEKAKLGNVVGALAMCGPLAGTRNWEGVLDLRLAYDAVCAGVPGAELAGGPKGLPNVPQLEPADVRAAVDFCTGIGKPKPMRTRPEQDRLSALLAVNGIAESGLQDAMQLATFGLSDLVRDRKKLKGKVPVGNLGVDYGSTSLNLAIERTEPNAKAARKLDQASELKGKTRGAKLITLHTSLDSVAFVENEYELAQLLPEENLVTGVIKEPKASHCGFTEVEELTAWETLVDWAGGGNRPKPKALQKRCARLRPVAPGACRFDNRPKLRPLDTRIRPRP